MSTDTVSNALVSRVDTEKVSSLRAVGATLFGRVRITQFGLVIVTLIVWQLVGQAVGSYYLAPPTDVISAAKETVTSGDLQRALVQSAETLFIGYGIAIIAGLVLGYLMGWYRFVGRVLDPFVNGLYVIPTTALVPLIVIWVGLGAPARVLTIFLFAVFQVLVSTYTGVRHRNEMLIDVARSFGATQSELLRKVVFFDSLPHIFAGLRLAASQSIKGMVIAEFLFAATGIGGAVQSAADHYQTALMFVYIMVTVVLGVLLAGFVQLLEHLLVKGSVA